MGKIDHILNRLDRVKSTGPGRWLACCPAHNDRHPSFTVRETEDNTILMKCWVGCSIDQILSALELEKKDLFPHRTEYLAQLKPHERWIPRDILACLADDLLRAYVYVTYTERGEPIGEKAVEDLENIARRFWAVVAEVYP